MAHGLHYGTHYELTRQERTQIDGRWHGARAPLCATGDGHYLGVNPQDFRPISQVRVTCPRCAERAHLIAPRERNLVVWSN